MGGGTQIDRCLKITRTFSQGIGTIKYFKTSLRPLNIVVFSNESALLAYFLHLFVCCMSLPKLCLLPRVVTRLAIQTLFSISTGNRQLATLIPQALRVDQSRNGWELGKGGLEWRWAQEAPIKDWAMGMQQQRQGGEVGGAHWWASLYDCCTPFRQFGQQRTFRC